MFKDRAIYFAPFDDDGIGKPEKISEVPNDVIVCDGCNSLIEDEDIFLLIIGEPRHESIWGSQCPKCVEKYYSELEIR